MHYSTPEIHLESPSKCSTLLCFRNSIFVEQKFGNGIKHSVVIPEVIDIENFHPKLFSNKFFHIHYGPLALRFRSCIEFMNS
jgi:hypothetical protein